ncbi:hypothetical protein SEA_VROOMVROOM_10 [Arthrobacter phage VroomVroom]|uniref:Uncharacterized protein n=1 Tax=Arthrobacter phage VroomVroom TaxID=3049371 RepID=A0AA49IV20_9CAUD|nr:hypothetical protein SEA_VROOMVROOM_10 [Arthrobacter phage VroomVroom]
MAAKIKLDKAGMTAMLKSGEVLAEVSSAASNVAGNINETAGDEPVEVLSGPHMHSDRAAAHVTLAHAAGLNIEAKRGTLARAAAAAGLEVTAK